MWADCNYRVSTRALLFILSFGEVQATIYIRPMGCSENRPEHCSNFKEDFPGLESILLSAKLVDRVVRKYTTDDRCSQVQFTIIMRKLNLWPLSSERAAFYACFEDEGGYNSFDLLVACIMHAQTGIPEERLQLLFEAVDVSCRDYVSAREKKQLLETMLKVCVSYPLRSFSMSENMHIKLRSFDDNDELIPKLIVALSPRAFLHSKDFVKLAKTPELKHIGDPTGFRKLLLSEYLAKIVPSSPLETSTTTESLGTPPQLVSPVLQPRRRKHRRRVTERGRQTSEYIRLKTGNVILNLPIE